MSEVELKQVTFTYPGADTYQPAFAEPALATDAGGQERAERETGGEEAPAIWNINLHLRPGTLTLLVGESGSGKSTILKACNGLIPKFHEGTLTGTVSINGRDIRDEPLHEAGRTSAMVFQNPRTQFFTNYVDTELAFVLENYGVDPEEIARRVANAATEAGITHLLGRKLDTLSGGELQRVACACALVAGVELLLFDEPTSNLDNPAIEEFANLVRQLKAAGKTLLIAEHRLHLFAGLADEVYRVSDGEIVEVFSAAQFFALSQDERIRRGLRNLEKVTADLPAPVPSNGSDLSVQDLVFSYREGRTVLDLPALQFPAGAVTAVTGANGAGKTTLARILCGLENPGKGTRITLGGKNLSVRRRQQVSSMVMQDVRRQLFSASALEEVTLGLGKDFSAKDAHRALAQLELENYAQRHPLSLSGGQAQRLVVATCLAAGSEVVIFDEPTSGVDWNHLCRIAAVLRELACRGHVVIVITHDHELIAQAAHYVCDLAAVNQANTRKHPQNHTHLEGNAP
ncbi:MAG: ABC transporter ATP-binding protein [Actinomycetaceae bacterium]|nr:ABC transporter ATP-binding protein [Actinomycetaceae bacterium]